MTINQKEVKGFSNKLHNLLENSTKKQLLNNGEHLLNINNGKLINKLHNFNTYLRFTDVCYLILKKQNLYSNNN